MFKIACANIVKIIQGVGRMKKLIRHSNYEQPFEDRRNNEMKLKDWFTPTTITTIIIALIAIIGYKFTLEATAETVKCHSELLASQGKEIIVLDKETARLDINQKEVIKKVDKILDNQDIMVKTLTRLETKIERL